MSSGFCRLDRQVHDADHDGRRHRRPVFHARRVTHFPQAHPEVDVLPVGRNQVTFVSQIIIIMIIDDRNKLVSYSYIY